MRYDRDFRMRGPRLRGGRGEYGLAGRSEYGSPYEGPASRHRWSEDVEGGTRRGRGSWNGGASDHEPGELRGEGELAWGRGYTGGRGHAGARYDLEREREGYAWGEAEVSESYGPARYGYGPYHHRLRRPRRSDDELRQEVEDTLFYDTWVDADAIAVRVEQGVVTLSGVLPNYEELRYAVDDAWDVDGVRGVRSELQVREDSDGSDSGGRGSEEE